MVACWFLKDPYKLSLRIQTNLRRFDLQSVRQNLDFNQKLCTENGALLIARNHPNVCITDKRVYKTGDIPTQMVVCDSS